jgi:rhodanese-related sulfurtransferase
MPRFLPFIPIPSALQDKSLVSALRQRLTWGEPALTIVDVRDRDAFNDGHIMGAIAMPMGELVARAQASLETIRDIYVYGETDAQTAAAADQLRMVGYQNIAELVGGLSAWRLARYPVEGF